MFEMLNASFASFAAAIALLNNLAFALPTDLFSNIAKRTGSTPRLIEYVQTFHPENNDNGYLSLLPLLNKDTSITHVILAALHINGPNGNITLNDDNPNSTYYDKTWTEAATLQQNGIKVMVMMGGAAQGSYDGRLCSKKDGFVQDDYYLPLVSTLKYHNVDGLDLDIEEMVPLACPENLVKRIRSDFGKEFIITMAPVASDMTGKGKSALGGFSYKKFDQSSAGPLVNWYNTQYYSGFVKGSLEDSYGNAINNGYSPSRIVMGVLDSSNDGSGFVSLKHVKEAIENLESGYHNFGGVDGFEYFDAGTDDGLSKPWMWVKQIGQTLFSSSSKRDIIPRSRPHPNHTPKLPAGVAEVMAHGHDQIAAARALRLAKGDVELGMKIVSER